MRLPTYALGLALLLAGCAHSSLVLLPDEDGGHGAVAFRKPDKDAVEVVVSEPNSRTSLDGSKPKTRPLGAKGLSARETALLDSLPPAPKTYSLYFLEGTTELTATSLTRLDEIRADIARRPGVEVEVTGHTDTVGDPDDNDALSRKRAAEVVDWLAKKGFDRAIMSAVGRGERELKVPTDDNVSSPVNRRVDIIVR
jgi:outer membrane protein OmpA-like peptidoglycan-associated protein